MSIFDSITRSINSFAACVLKLYLLVNFFTYIAQISI
jgi:hypothetical protein